MDIKSETLVIYRFYIKIMAKFKDVIKHVEFEHKVRGKKKL